MVLLYITDRVQFPGDENAHQRALLAKIAEATRCGVDLVQLREKDLPTCELEVFARKVLKVIRENSETTRLLINSRSDVAIAWGADGVHLRSNDISPSEVQKLWAQAGHPARPLVSVSCHSAADVAHAAAEGADFAVFAPVFGKKDAPPVGSAGINGLREACREKIPILALGCVTLANARDCRDAGAAGIAAIRLFQENDIAEVVRYLRG